MKKRFQTLAIVLLSASLLFACDKNENTGNPGTKPDPTYWSGYSNKIILDWNLIALEAMGGPTYTFPLVNSRINAMMHIAMHDALNSIAPVYETYAYKGSSPGADPIAAVATAAHDVLIEHFPEQTAMLDTHLKGYLDSLNEGDQKTKGIAAGKAAAAAILDLRKGDGAFADPIGTNVPSTVPGVYQATEPYNFIYGEFWRNMKPFALQNPKQFRSAPHPALSSQEYAKEFDEVKSIGEMNSTHRSDDESFTGKYWYELSEMGWNKVGRIVASQEKLDLPKTARLFALLDMALADAYIAGWDSKYHYNFWRPITAIQTGDDTNPTTVADPDWQPSEPTPPVPDYPSTHSALGNTAATVLTNIVGEHIHFTMQSTTAVPNISRSFNSFHQAADENANSRVIAGIHFRSACEAGQILGNEVGNWTLSSYLKPLK